MWNTTNSCIETDARNRVCFCFKRSDTVAIKTKLGHTPFLLRKKQFLNRRTIKREVWMPNYILTTSSTIMCPHGAVVNHIPTYFGSYRVNGEIPMLRTDQYLIAGCPFILPLGMIPLPNPCIRIMWISASNFLFVRGVQALTNVSIGICQSANGIPPGPPIITAFQTVETEPNTLKRVD